MFFKKLYLKYLKYKRDKLFYAASLSKKYHKYVDFAEKTYSYAEKNNLLKYL